MLEDPFEKLIVEIESTMNEAVLAQSVLGLLGVEVLDPVASIAGPSER